VCYLKKKKKTLKLTRFRILGDSIHFDIASWNLVLPSNFAFPTRERGTSCGERNLVWCGGDILAKILLLFLYSDAHAKGFSFYKVHSDKI
jgi:hypothetical protein